jgi:MFS family permease
MARMRVLTGIGRTVFAVGLVSLFMDISSEMVYPLVPIFLTGVLGATKTTVGVIEGVAEATASLLKVFSGWLSDRLGRRKLLMAAGYGISVVSRPVMAGASSPIEVLAARFIDRLGKGVRTAPRDAIIADSTEASRLGAAFGFHRAMDTVGAILGPAAAFAILYFLPGRLRTVFLVAAIPGAIAVALIILLVREKRRAPGAAPAVGAALPPTLAMPSFDGPFRRYMLAMAIFSLGNFADAFMVLMAQAMGVRVALIPVIYLIFNVVYAFSSAPMGALADAIGIRNMVVAGFVFYSAIFAGLAAATAPFHMWMLFPLYGLYKGMSEGSQRAYLASIAPRDRLGTAFGAYHTVSGVMLLPASIIAGLLWDSAGPHAAFAFGGAASATAALIFLSPRGRPRA